MTARAQTVTILFTDLVGSTELLQRAGDEQAQRIFKAHHRLLREAVEAHGGNEVKWLGDGLMVAFDSAADAVKCAIAMQQSSRRPTAGERLEIRAGLHVGEAFVDESDYFGTSVVIARRLCDKGDAGQILASDLVARLLDGRGEDLNTKDLGPLDLKGITNAVPAVEIVYQHDPMALLRKLPFVGRHDEYEAMLKKLAEARNGRGSVILLAGEPGIGKTRLTEEFCDHASSGATVIRGNCYEGDVSAPFGPWTEALRSLIEQTPDAELRATLGPGAPDIAVMMPEIKRRIPDLEEAPKLDPESERARLFESIAAFLRNAAEKKPLVIFLDDLHWCDRPSLALLEQVARGCADKRIVVVGTYRDVEVDRVHPLAQTLGALRRMEHHERISLRGVTEYAVEELFAAVEPSEEAAAGRQALAQALHAESEGNPFFIREVLNHLVETGNLKHEGGRWQGGVATVAAMGIPEGIKEVIGRRLSRLSETCNRMLGRASAMTSGFTWDELRAICDDPEDALLDALDEALGSQLISERASDTYAFTHALIRATLYDELNKPRRVQLHRRIAESLESLYADSIDDHLSELAAHYIASTGNAAEKAVEYSIRAGDRARESYAWEDASAHYERALAAMGLGGKQDDEQSARVLLSLAECQHNGGDPSRALDSLRACAEIARRARNSDLLARCAYGFRDSAYYSELDVAEECLVLVDEALAAVGIAPSLHRARLLGDRVMAAASASSARSGADSRGFLAQFGGQKDPILLSQAREALDLARQFDDDAAICRAAFQFVQLSWSPDNAIERRDLIDVACAAAERTEVGFPDHPLIQRSYLALELGDIAGFRQVTDEIAELVERARFKPMSYQVPSSVVALQMAEGQLDLAEATRADYASAAESPDAGVTAVGQLYLTRDLQGRLAELEPLWVAVSAQNPHIPLFNAILAGVCMQAAKVSQAERMVEQMASNLAAIPRDWAWKSTLNVLAETCAETAQRAEARPLYEALVPYASANATVVQVVTFGCIARVVGRLAVLLERYDEAEQHFEQALASNDKQGFHAWTAMTRLNYGDMLLRRNRPGDRDRAVALLQQAHDFAKQSGMAKVERDSERLLATGGG